MAFVSVIESDDYDAEYFRRGNTHAILVRVGYDPEADKNYFLQVGLTPTAGTGQMEYYFLIREVCSISQEYYDYYNARAVASFIERDTRQKILAILMSCTHTLLEAVQPESVYRCTYDEYPPEKALEKHELITHVFHKCGYSVVRSDPYSSKRVWVMERNREPVVSG